MLEEEEEEEEEKEEKKKEEEKKKKMSQTDIQTEEQETEKMKRQTNRRGGGQEEEREKPVRKRLFGLASLHTLSSPESLSIPCITIKRKKNVAGVKSGESDVFALNFSSFSYNFIL